MATTGEELKLKSLGERGRGFLRFMVLMFVALAPIVFRMAAGEAQAGSIQSAPQTPSTADREEIEHIIATYAKSIDGADTTLASEIWADSPDVSFIHPLGHEHGFAQIRRNVYEHLMGETFSERRLTVHDASIYVYENAAWAEFYWDFAAKFRKDGSPITTHGRETQIYRKAQGAWRLVHVHYSGMPVTEERKGF